MATVLDYFETDFPHVIPFDQEVGIELTNRSGTIVTRTFRARIHSDYDANAIFLSAYISDPEYSIELADSFLEHAEEVAGRAQRIVLSSGLAGDPQIQGPDLRFAGRVFLYIDADIPESRTEALVGLGKDRGLEPIVRGRFSASARTREETPVAFISYDSRDKDDIAKPLALKLAAFGCPVWFDEFSLRVGDSLRESIERGLRECEKCILVVSPHFLANTGWTKTEFNAIFTREIHERNHVILPVWAGVTAQDIYEYSPTLKDRFAIFWERGLDEVVQEIRRMVSH